MLAVALVGCGGALPPDAKKAVLSGFEPGDKARIDSARQAEPLREDLEIGAEEVWCTNVTFACRSCDYGEWRTCCSQVYLSRKTVAGTCQVLSYRVRRLFVGISDSKLFVTWKSGNFCVFQAVFADVGPQKRRFPPQNGTLQGSPALVTESKAAFSYAQSSHPELPSLLTLRANRDKLTPI